MNQTKTDIMREFKKVTINAKELRSTLKAAGIKAVQLRSHKGGVLVCIEDAKNQPAMFIDFCKENGLKQNPLKDMIVDMGGIKNDFRSFGYLFKYEEI